MQILNKEQILNVAGGSVACECGCNIGARFTALSDKDCHDRCCTNPKVPNYRSCPSNQISVINISLENTNANCKPCTMYGAGILTRSITSGICAILSNR